MDRATATRALRFLPGRNSLTLGEAVTGRHQLIATCLSCWHQKVGIEPGELVAQLDADTSVDEVAKRMRCAPVRAGRATGAATVTPTCRRRAMTYLLARDGMS